jgi:hypothetical protein
MANSPLLINAENQDHLIDVNFENNVSDYTENNIGHYIQKNLKKKSYSKYKIFKTIYMIIILILIVLMLIGINFIIKAHPIVMNHGVLDIVCDLKTMKCGIEV